VYIAEGCVACHTQQVRPLKMDAVCGRPSTAGDYAHVQPAGLLQPYAPAVLGSERTGPDLTSIGSRQPSATWQYIHLYQPRAVVPDSIMPAFTWLFEVVDEPPADAVEVPLPAAWAPPSGTVVASERAKALIAYLASLKQVALKAGEIGVGGPAPAATSSSSGSGAAEGAK
jgi:cytochrome c oxidase cbb3-type subunit II